MKEDKEKKRIWEEKTKKGEELAVRAVDPCEFLTKLGEGELGADVRTDLWHRYRDRTWFRYEVVISRIEGKVERRFELSVRFFPFCFLFGVGLKGGVTHLHHFPPIQPTSSPTCPTLPIHQSIPANSSIPNIPTNTPPPPALRIQRPTPPLLVRRQVLQTQGRQPAKLLPPQRHARSLLARVHSLQALLREEDGHPLGETTHPLQPRYSHC